ncbi:MAG TPA: flagellar assembly peptidoglycan hydrolase FlgJ [Rhodocyclaceae bacterium]
MLGHDLTSQLAADAKSLNDMRTLARTSPREGVRVAAQQFEAYFLQMVMKSMRDATPSDGLFDSDQSRMYTGLLDQQLTQSLSSRGTVGFARMIEAQLAAQLERLAPPADGAAAGTGALPPGATVQPAVPTPTSNASPAQAAVQSAPARPAAHSAAAIDNPVPATDWRAETPREFVERVWPHAVEAAAELKVPPHYLVAHAALESGWGQHEPLREDGSPSFNLFGVKAGRGWAGDSVSARTDEYVDGQRVTANERFRAYDSYGESFRDYARLLAGSQRYAGVLGASDGMDFATNLQQAGYATDPMYADKLARIIGGNTLKHALLG